MSTYTHPITQLVHSTVRMLCIHPDGRQSTGTGYIYSFYEENGTSCPCVVTNKHVVINAKQGVFNLTLKNSDDTPNLGKHETVILNDLQQYCIPHPNPNVDLVALPIGPILNSASSNGRDYYFISLGAAIVADEELLSSLPPMEEIVMIGYPNGLWDERHNLPIIRKGITATHPRLELNGRPEFLIDAACFPGSSGSPVFLANIGSYVSPDGALCVGNRVALLGTLYAGPQHTTTGEIVVIDVPTDTKSVAVGTIPNNLGYVIRAKELGILENEVRKKLSQQPNPFRNSPCTCGSGRRYKHCCGAM